MATVVHFDLSADDPPRAEKFYGEVFGWKFQPLADPPDYYLIETQDLDGRPGVGGGMAKREKGQRPGITNFIGVKSIDEVLKKVVTSGGKVLQPKQSLPGWGFLALCEDTEGNVFGLFASEPPPG